MRIIIGMATFSQRDPVRKHAIKSLQNQTVKPTKIVVYNNTTNEVDLTDNGKFYALKDINEPCYFLSVDDDLYYPPDYIEKTIAGIEKYGCIVTWHGRKLTGLNKNYYRGHTGFRCLGKVEKDTLIDIAGTGVTGFRTDYFCPSELYKANDKRMSDCVFSLEVAKQQKNIIILAHEEGWLRDLHAPYETSCHALESRKPVRQGEIANEIYKLNYGL